MNTQTSTKLSNYLSLLTQGKQTAHQENVIAAQPQAAAVSRRSLYALGLGLRLAFFLGLIIHAMILLNHW